MTTSPRLQPLVIVLFLVGVSRLSFAEVRVEIDVPSDGSLKVKMERTEEQGPWLVTLNQSGKVISQKSVPEWLGAEYYAYSVQERLVSEVPIVLFEARPRIGSDAPADTDLVQVAWAKPEGKKWRNIAFTRSSTLDGGDRVTFRNNELLMIKSDVATQFCGSTIGSHQVFDPKTMAFRSRVSVGTFVGSSMLKPELPESFEATRFDGFVRWSTTSSNFKSRNDRGVLRPSSVGDNDLNTTWFEGTEGDGAGEFVTARINTALKTTGVRIFPGAGKSDADHRKYGKPTEVLLTTSTGQFLVSLPDEPFDQLKKSGGYWIKFPEPLRTHCLSVTIVKTRPGADRKSQDVVGFAEISPLNEFDALSDREAADRAVQMLMDEPNINKKRRLAQLIRPLDAELVKIIERILQTNDEKERARVVPLLRHLPSEQSVNILVRLFDDLDPTDAAYSLVKPAISAHGQSASAELVALMSANPPRNKRKYVDLTRLIGRLAEPEQFGVLIDQLGEGVPHTRRERIRAVAHGTPKVIPQLIEIATSHVDDVKGEDALQAIVGVARKAYSKQPGSVDGIDQLVRIYDSAKQRRTRTLAVRAASYFDFDNDDDFFLRAAEDKQAVVRKYTARGLRSSASQQSRQALVEMLSDPSPSVRLAAIETLAVRSDGAETVDAVSNYFARETWRGGVQSAARLLAESKSPKGTQALVDTLADSSKEKAEIAARALAQAGVAAPFERVAPLLKKREIDRRVRRRLIDLLGVDTSQPSTDFLSELIASETPFESVDEKENSALRKRAILAIGRHRNRPSAMALLKVLRTSNDNKVRAVALRALGFSYDPWVAQQLREMKNDIPDVLKDDYLESIGSIERRDTFKSLENVLPE